MGKNVFKAKIVVLLLAWLSVVLELFAIYAVKSFIHLNGVLLYLLCNLVALVSYVILALYFTIGYPNGKYHSMLPVAIGMVAVPYLLDVFNAHMFVFMLSDIVIITMVVFIILSSENKKTLIIVTSIIGIIIEIFEIFILCMPFSFVRLSRITFWATLLVFLLKNRIFPIVDSAAKKSVTPENNTLSAQNLRNLKDMLDKGQITEEQYQNARADIINKL